MKENHLLVTYGGMFMIVLIAKKKELLKKITLEGKKKKSSQHILKERYEVGDPKVDLLREPLGKFNFYVLYPRTKKQKPPPTPSCAGNYD